ncbi:hypothetical protein FHR53_002978 [Xanthomonas arboricola]
MAMPYSPAHSFDVLILKPLVHTHLSDANACPFSHREKVARSAG